MTFATAVNITGDKSLYDADSYSFSPVMGSVQHNNGILTMVVNSSESDPMNFSYDVSIYFAILSYNVFCKVSQFSSISMYSFYVYLCFLSQIELTDIFLVPHILAN